MNTFVIKNLYGDVLGEFNRDQVISALTEALDNQPKLLVRRKVRFGEHVVRVLTREIRRALAHLHNEPTGVYNVIITNESSGELYLILGGDLLP